MICDLFFDYQLSVQSSCDCEVMIFSCTLYTCFYFYLSIICLFQTTKHPVPSLCEGFTVNSRGFPFCFLCVIWYNSDVGK